MNTDTLFKLELTALLNKHSKKNYSDAPDFILAEFLINQLEYFHTAGWQRDRWINDQINSLPKTTSVGPPSRVEKVDINAVTNFAERLAKAEELKVPLDIITNGVPNDDNIAIRNAYENIPDRPVWPTGTLMKESESVGVKDTTDLNRLALGIGTGVIGL